ncbi:indolepyruvate ferredoxin oxidoreductase family protein [Lampropedia puyangensis]|uniref:indolepyruvate ferredoxin oxidoreductase family protein n=1 Tax=Lampropedia puyangensis TaxID=1330072 RepID=UPI001FCEAA6E|nr:indolepyruvate ferredoxin oxidoreductase family protein [Lampropedia puyangensis]
MNKPQRSPSFCSGCPHNRSTKVPQGSRALAGIGCHTMAMLADPLTTTTVSHMGAEGVMWLGQQPFTSEKHVFANLGDGTFSHSGFLAVRQAIAAKVPITYKILYNGFVSMTGGQSVETGLSPQQILAGLAAEGIQKMAVVTDEPEKYKEVNLPAGVQVHHRSELDAVQRTFREYPDVSVILYDQPCATERRRLRKRGKWHDPAKRSFINPAVCEGCGDCGKASNCMSIEPLETPLGRKRRINQGTCNKDFTCMEGFCPSFVSVEGGQLKKNASQKAAPSLAVGREWQGDLPLPTITALQQLHSVLIAGIGGTGVVTIGQTLAMAAHIDGYFSSNLDVTGLAQKYGAVHSHVRWAPAPEMLHATRIAKAEAHSLIGCDLIVAASDDSITKLHPQAGAAVVCTDVIPTAEFARNPDWAVNTQQLSQLFDGQFGERALLLEGQRLATTLMGDPIAANMFMLGAAWQLGHIPLSLQAIERAIELNGVAIAMNKESFTWGRRAAHDLAQVEAIALSKTPRNVIQFVPRQQQTLEQTLAHRREHLKAYGSPALLQRYENMLAQVQSAEARLNMGNALSAAVAHSYHRLLAVKDEWEVARLYSHPDFSAALNAQFEGDYRLKIQLGVWPFARRNKATGAIEKGEVGDWILHVFKWLSKSRNLRGSWLDPFRWSAERKLERALRAEYEADIQRLLSELDADRLPLAIRIAQWPDAARGYGHVKEAQARIARSNREQFWQQWHANAQTQPIAAKAA